MRHAALLFALFLSGLASSATNYYFSSSAGSDSRTSTQAKNPSTPWKTLGKLNSFFASLQPGDSVLFKRGDTFYGSLTITKSGTSSKAIVLGAYGTGSKPVITGFTALANWASVGSGVYESSTVLFPKAVNVLLINGAVQQMGRYPNTTAPDKGWLFLESHNGTSSITDKELTTSTNWKGAEVVVRSWKSAIDRATITAHSGGTLSASLTYEPHDGFGYFIQNDVRTLDVKGEWYYNKSSRKMRVYYGSSAPASGAAKASTVDTLVYATDRSYVHFTGISFQGANLYALYLRYCNNIRITGCEFLYTGGDAFHLKGSSYLTVTNNVFNYSFTNAILPEITGTNWTISDNVIDNTAMYEGMCQKADNTGYAIYTKGDNHTIERNTIDSTGFVAIRFTGNNILIRNNVISYFNMIKNDGGGIYTWQGSATNRKVIGNILTHGYGANEGIGLGGGSSCSGIYLDNDVSGVEVSGNSVATCSKAGIFLHNAYNIKMRDNTLFDNSVQVVMSHDGMADAALRNLNIKSNIFFAKKTMQRTLSVVSNQDDVDQMGSIDSNYHCRPTDETFVNAVSYHDAADKKIAADYDLKDWQINFPYDKHGSRTTQPIPTYTVNALLSSNKFANGSFNRDINGMFANSGSSWISAKLDGGTYQAKVPSTSTGFQLIPSVGAVSSAKNYIVRFSAQSTKDTVFSVYLRQNGSPYTVLSDVRQFKVGTTRREYEFMLPNPMSQSDAGLVFSTKAKGFTFWMDNIRLYEANVTLTNLNQLIRFEYNPTKTAKTINLGSGSYMDAKNKVYAGSITLQPYTSLVLMQSANLPQSLVETEEQPANEAAWTPLPETSAGTNSGLRIRNAYPNPSTSYFNLLMEGGNNEPVNLNVYDLSGRLVEKKMGIAANAVTQFGYNLPRGMYVVQAVQGTQQAQLKVTKL